MGAEEGGGKVFSDGFKELSSWSPLEYSSPALINTDSPHDI
jgi:hypothetical protein